MSRALTDHELTVMVESAGQGATDSWAGHYGSRTWSDLDAGEKNTVRETALPWIYHGTKVLPDLGWARQRIIHTVEELRQLPALAVVLFNDTENGGAFQTYVVPDDGSVMFPHQLHFNNFGEGYIDAADMPLPVRVIFQP